MEEEKAEKPKRVYEDLPNLLGQEPEAWLAQGPTKRYIDKYLFHEPKVGIVASYTPTQANVDDHFDVFRGVDMVESFAQATVVSCATFLECKKMSIIPDDLGKLYIPAFISIGQVNFHFYLEKGQTFINIGYITFYKWRQMVCSGRIYKVPPGLDLEEYFKNFTKERLLSYDLSSDFVLIAELSDITGRAIKKELFEK